jgi:dTDP-4-dehydrorhamnose 3,5-epimerase
MLFFETRLSGAFTIEPQRDSDERGFFARTWTAEEFREHGLDPQIAQCCVAYNAKRATIRGLHYQIAPSSEAKLVRCTRGTIYDVAVDLRIDSPTYLQWAALELSEDNGIMFYIPEGFAHGYQTLQDETEVFYQISAKYCPAAGRGIRWNDPAVGIEWPLPVSVISPRDQNLPLIQEGAFPK